MKRLLRLAAAAATVAAVAGGGTAHADPPVPTNERAAVVSVQPPTDAARLDVVGGGSYLQLTVRPGTTAAVPGYRQEPYLRFEADGTVFENRAAPSYFLNRSRTGDPIPAGITAASPPMWVQVAGNGSYVWHDHRTHWMGAGVPRDVAVGEVFLDNRVPFTVDGVDHEARVVSVWEGRPSLLPGVLGVLAGGAVVALVVVRGRRAVLCGVGGSVACIALAAGAVQYRSVPALTGPRPTLWVLPALALLASVLAAALWRRLGWVVGHGLVALTGVQLALWAWGRRAGLTHSVLPTDLWWPLDRALTAGVGVVAVGLVVAAVHPVVRVALEADRTKAVAGG